MSVRAAGPRHRWLALGVWLLLLLAGVGVIARSHFSADLSAFLPASPDAKQRMLIEQLQSGMSSAWETMQKALEKAADELRK